MVDSLRTCARGAAGTSVRGSRDAGHVPWSFMRWGPAHSDWSRSLVVARASAGRTRMPRFCRAESRLDRMGTRRSAPRTVAGARCLLATPGRDRRQQPGRRARPGTKCAGARPAALRDEHVRTHPSVKPNARRAHTPTATTASVESDLLPGSQPRDERRRSRDVVLATRARNSPSFWRDLPRPFVFSSRGPERIVPGCHRTA